MFEFISNFLWLTSSVHKSNENDTICIVFPRQTFTTQTFCCESCSFLQSHTTVKVRSEIYSYSYYMTFPYKQNTSTISGAGL